MVTKKRSMLFPELSRKNLHGLAPTSSFFRGLYRRITMKDRRKIFVIGFHKTGTTSLAKALQVLGYRVCGFVNPSQGIEYKTHTKEELFDTTYRPLLEQYDAFEDTPWFIFYKELLEIYPDARFILTVRSPEGWYRSALKHFGGFQRRSFQWIYNGMGDPVGNRTLYLKTYNTHNREVIDYFKQRNKRLLVMNLPDDFNWETLCEFLECDIPRGEFPHANSISSRDTIRRKLLDHVKTLYYTG